MRGWQLVIIAAACTSAPRESERAQALTQCAGSAVVEGVDVSKFQGTINWSQLASSGHGFAFIKATQGTYNVQTTFGADWAGAKAAGVLRSPYHFFDANDDGIDQANAFLAEIGSAGGYEVGDLPPLLDLECPTSANEATTMSNCEGFAGGSGWVDNATLKQRTYDFLTTVEAATGVKPLIYSYVSWFASLGFTDAELGTYPLYIASYNSCATIPAPWTSAVFWQYSSTGSAAGIMGQVDVDRFFGSAGDLAAITKQPPTNPLVDAGIPATGDAGLDPGPGSGCGCQGGGGAPGAMAAGICILLARRRRKLAR